MRAGAYLRPRALSGFSLLETALALAVMGIVVAGLVALLQQFRSRQQAQLTRTNQERILHALGHYIARHGRLPCPADPKRGDHSGEAMRDCCASPGRIQGYVPFVTLGLPRQVALNGRGIPFTYVVNPLLTRPAAASVSSKRLWCGHRRKHILRTEAQNGKGGDDPVAVVLISYRRKTKWEPAGNPQPDGRWMFSTAFLASADVRVETAANVASYYAQIVCSPSGS
jgi:type II secretory pathway pseudopilin PulG